MDNALYINIFILISITLTAGYFFGRKKNRAIAASSINTLLKILKPERQEITNIGGLVGYHLRMWFNGEKVEKAQGTITLLPRHSLLYLPISRGFRGFDRFFITISLNTLPVRKGARLFEKRFYHKYREDEGIGMQVESISRGRREFLLFYENGRELSFLRDLLSGIENPAKLKEVSIRPEKGMIEILVVPSAGDNRVLESIIRAVL
ncbi:MAG: hypothetical protein R6U43_04895 [Candidatus Krumholzibacteriales bacterium]